MISFGCASVVTPITGQLQRTWPSTTGSLSAGVRQCHLLGLPALLAFTLDCTSGFRPLSGRPPLLGQITPVLWRDRSPRPQGVPTGQGRCPPPEGDLQSFYQTLLPTWGAQQPLRSCRDSLRGSCPLLIRRRICRRLHLPSLPTSRRLPPSNSTNDRVSATLTKASSHGDLPHTLSLKTRTPEQPQVHCDIQLLHLPGSRIRDLTAMNGCRRQRTRD
mmetsp:Transcript_204/g.665  ORF Transcript_204/g.665 Transcript_204/m.665 type:complete len:217 (-) Transcript_204:645-1295(-)